MRLTITLTTFALLTLTACGGTPQRAPMPDVASTDQSADDMGLPAVEPQSGGEAPTSEGQSEGQSGEGESAAAGGTSS
ncbi:MAG: hypothetical protein K1X94_04790 [Sandaracinaceae bacterium]|nr:hypothetical protein [Sandaracinaceae bacterium]